MMEYTCLRIRYTPRDSAYFADHKKPSKVDPCDRQTVHPTDALWSETIVENPGPDDAS